MTDREEFEKWFKAEFNADYYPTEAMYLAWLARGELDAVKIKELEADQEGLLDDTQKLANALLAQEKQTVELTAKNKELVMHLSNMMECTVGFAPSTRFIVNAREALAKEELDK